MQWDVLGENSNSILEQKKWKCVLFAEIISRGTKQTNLSELWNRSTETLNQATKSPFHKAFLSTKCFHAFYNSSEVY